MHADMRGVWKGAVCGGGVMADPPDSLELSLYYNMIFTKESIKPR